MNGKYLIAGLFLFVLVLAVGCSSSTSPTVETQPATTPSAPVDPQERNRDILKSQANLAHLGAAFKANPTLIGAGFTDREGKPLLSWRVWLLAQMGQEEIKLLNKFKLREPWDSEHNKKLLAEMPDVFKPVRGTAPPGYTYYRVFQGEQALFPTKHPPATVFHSLNGQQCTPVFAQHNLTQVTDGTALTYLVVEGGEAVPWTKPDELAVEKGKPLPKLGGMFEGDFNVLLCDGITVGLVKGSTPEDQIRAASTAVGGEIVDPAALGKKEEAPK